MRKILILGATGMLGHTVLTDLYKKGFEVYATCRSISRLDQWFSYHLLNQLINGVEADNFNSIIKVFGQPDIVINCIGIIKQLPPVNDPITAININSLFPHKLARLCAPGARFIHFSTDCVFDRVKGAYTIFLST